MLSAIILGANKELIHWLSNICSDMGDLCMYKTLFAYPEPYELIKLLDVFEPEVVFLDMESSATALTVARKTRAGHPKSAIVGFARHCDWEQEAREAGVNEILRVPVEEAEVRKVVLRAVQAQSAGVSDNIITFLPGKAGSGASTTVLHVAASLAQDWKQRVLVLEADSQSGSLAVMLNLEADSEHSIMKALEESQSLHEDMWKGLLNKVRGFDLLPMPTTKADAEISRWEYQRLLTFARSRYDLVLMDLPELAEQPVEAVANQAKAIYVVTTPDRASLLMARRRIDELRSRGAPDRCISVVLNRCWERNAETQKLVKSPEVEKILEHPVSVMLPHEDSLMRRPLSDSSLAPAHTELGREFLCFAARLAGKEPPPPPLPLAPPPESKLGLKSLFRSKVLQRT